MLEKCCEGRLRNLEWKEEKAGNRNPSRREIRETRNFHGVLRMLSSTTDPSKFTSPDFSSPHEPSLSRAP